MDAMHLCLVFSSMYNFAVNKPVLLSRTYSLGKEEDFNFDEDKDKDLRAYVLTSF